MKEQQFMRNHWKFTTLVCLRAALDDYEDTYGKDSQYYKDVQRMITQTEAQPDEINREPCYHNFEDSGDFDGWELCRWCKLQRLKEGEFEKLNNEVEHELEHENNTKDVS